MQNKIVAVSGGFDPLHKGHVAMIEEAAQYGRVHVYLNSDEWLIRKKGYVFMPWHDRASILLSMKGVELVIPVLDTDDTVCETIRRFKPDIFCNGGDRLPDNTPELVLCCDMGIQVKFNVGGGKVESSSKIVRKHRPDPSFIDKELSRYGYGTQYGQYLMIVALEEAFKHWYEGMK